MGLLDRLLGRHQPTGSGAVAKERLKLVLEYDRAQLTPEELDSIRHDIIASISRHVAVAAEDVHVTLEQGGRLVAEIPLGRGAGARPS
jgi:cell division topological specificity factor MinE